MSELRVISLVPSATETLLAWGVRPVAVSRFCEQPGFATVGGTKDPHIGEIIAMRPDVVIMCDQENRIEDASALSDAGIAVHAISITAVDHVGPQMSALALAVGADRAPLCGLALRSEPSAGDSQYRVRAWIPICASSSRRLPSFRSSRRRDAATTRQLPGQCKTSTNSFQ